MTVREFIEKITDGFEGQFSPPFEYLLFEYNRIVRALLLMLPTSNTSVTVTPSGGKLECGLEPLQVRRVIAADTELLRASKELIELIPEAKLYHAANDGIYVTVNCDCTVCYRSLPNVLSADEADSENVYGDTCFAALVRAYLTRSAYLYVGDSASADVYAAEYNSLLEDYKRENGVTV